MGVGSLCHTRLSLIARTIARPFLLSQFFLDDSLLSKIRQSRNILDLVNECYKYRIFNNYFTQYYSSLHTHFVNIFLDDLTLSKTKWSEDILDLVSEYYKYNIFYNCFYMKKNYLLAYTFTWFVCFNEFYFKKN